MDSVFVRAQDIDLLQRRDVVLANRLRVVLAKSENWEGAR
jgi:hypothetical protein